LDKGLLEK